jgi:hypothetical protein
LLNGRFYSELPLTYFRLIDNDSEAINVITREIAIATLLEKSKFLVVTTE